MSSELRNLNLDHDESRAIHRIVRAMHDGECPKCHQITQASYMREEYSNHHALSIRGGWRCIVCGFEIHAEEADAALQIFAPFMQRNLEVFEKWRASREVVS